MKIKQLDYIILSSVHVFIKKEIITLLEPTKFLINIHLIKLEKDNWTLIWS